MNDLATIHGAPQTIKLSSGKEYQAYPITLRDHGRLQAWIDEQQETRLLEMVERMAKRNAVTIEVQKYGVEAALKVAARNRILLGTPEADALLDGLDGKVFLTWLAISKGDPKFTLDDAWSIAIEQADAAEKAATAADAMRAGDPKSAATVNGSSPTAEPSPSPSTGGA